VTTPETSGALSPVLGYHALISEEMKAAENFIDFIPVQDQS
jgi:hypothetical protein